MTHCAAEATIKPNMLELGLRVRQDTPFGTSVRTCGLGEDQCPGASPAVVPISKVLSVKPIGPACFLGFVIQARSKVEIGNPK